MLRKLISLSLVAVMLSVTALAATDIADLQAAYAEGAVEETTPVFAYAGGDVEYVTETAKVADAYLSQAKHEDVADLPAWDGSALEQPAAGDGTAENPYQIANGAQLAWFASAVNGTLKDDDGNAIAADADACAKLVRDINLKKEDGAQTNNWTTYSMVSYTGTFDGQGHNLYGFYCSSTTGRTENLDDSTTGKRGLFSYVTGAGCVKNLNMIDAKGVYGTGRSDGGTASAIVCSILGGTQANYEAGIIPTINNVYVSGSTNLPESNQRMTLYGSVVAKVKFGDVYNCFSDVEVNLTGQKGTLDTYDNAIVKNKTFGTGGVIGVLAHDRNYAKVYNCGNSGKITAPDSYRVGGVIGAIQCSTGYSNFWIYNLYNTGDIIGEGVTAGVVGNTGISDVNGFSDKGSDGKDRYWSWFNNFGWYNTGDITVGTTENSYVAGVTNLFITDVTNGRYPNHFYSTGDVKVITTDATTKESVESFGDTCALVANVNGISSSNIVGKKCLYRNDLGTAQITLTNPGELADDTSDDTTEVQTVSKWPIYYVSGTATTETNTKYHMTGTGKSINEIGALTADEIKTAVGSAFVTDCNINNGLPILAAQKDFLVLDETVYEIANYTNSASEAVDKNLAIKATEAGYVALNVTKFVEGSSATLEVYKTDGTKLYDKAVSATGVVLLPTEGEIEVVVKAAAGSRILAKQAEIPALAGLEAALIKATLDSASDATIVLALFNGDTLEAVEYLTNVTSVDGKVTGVIDLTEETVADCTLKAYVWANDTLVPVSATVETLN